MQVLVSELLLGGEPTPSKPSGESDVEGNGEDDVDVRASGDNTFCDVSDGGRAGRG